MELQANNLDEQLKNVELKIKELELKHKNWELFVKLSGILTIVLPVLVFLWSINAERMKESETQKQAAATQDREAITQELAASKPFLERQFALYMEATNVASRLATLADGVEREKARKRFYELYWGELALVEDTQVEEAMVMFSEAVTVNDRNQMTIKAYALAHACRKSLSSTWGSKLPVVGIRPPPASSPATSTPKQ